MKKKILTMGSVLALAMPITVVIACGNNDSSNTDQGPTEAERLAKLAKIKQEAIKKLATKLRSVTRVLQEQHQTLKKIKMLPSSEVVINGSNILTKMFQYSTMPKLFENITFKDISAKPNDAMGSLLLTFKIEASAKVQTETITSISDPIALNFKYQTTSENKTFKIEQEIDGLTNFYALNKPDEEKNPFDFYAIPFVSSSTLTLKNMEFDDQFNKFRSTGDPARDWIDDKYKSSYNNTPITDRSEIIKYSNLFGINLYDDPRIKDKFKIVSIQMYSYASSDSGAEWYKNRPIQDSMGYIQLNLTLEKEGVQKTILALITGFPSD